MIRLTNIVIDNDIIKCDIFPEDSLESGNIEIDMRKNLTSVVLPQGFEWCKNHITHAKDYLVSLFSSNLDIPKNFEKTIMWY